MKLYWVFLIYGTSCLYHGTESRNPAIPAKKYKVDLDAPATKRWIPVLQDFDISSIMAVLNTLANKFIKSKKELMELADILARDLEKYMPQPYADEMQGIADYYNKSVGVFVIANLIYDITAWHSIAGSKACTSIVSMDKDNKIIHGRNLDHDPADLLRNITVDVEFHHSGKIAFIGTHFVGSVGTVTAVKPNAFSISLNERNTGMLLENILSLLEKHWPTILFAREVITNAENYDSAIQMLSKADTIAPIYFIVGGVKPREGAVVVGDRWGVVNVTRMEDTPHDWFVLETNYDPWKKPPAFDDRRDTGVRAMEIFGQARMDLDNLYGVLSIPPVFNYNTTFTTVMSAADLTAYRTMIRYNRPDEE